MVFSSVTFLFFFLPILLFVYYFADGKFKNSVLLMGSLFFYAWGEPKNVLLMLLSIVVNYLLGIFVEKYQNKKIILAITLIFNLGMLFVFKYLNFAVDTMNQLLHRDIQVAQIALPIGISFYTFQILSYVIDVYRGEVKAQRNILHLGLYISLFPQLIAGPIVRYVDVEKQISKRTVDLEKFRIGVIRFMVGFSKKVLIADQLAVLVDACFAATNPSIGLNWIGIIAYSLQIFFDFSGYSDMAIGLGKMFGFDFLENFNFPYISQSIQEFWRRWHISLSSWFRDYVYIPLGGSRAGKVRTYINLIVVFGLTGLWHGASYNFVVWGLFYAVFLVLERLGLAELLKRLPRVFRHMYTIFIIMIGWIFFRAETLTAAIQYIGGMFQFAGKDMANFAFVMNNKYWFCLIAGIFFSIPHPKISAFFNKSNVAEFFRDILIMAIFVIAICYMVGSGYSPFLYFRF